MNTVRQTALDRWSHLIASAILVASAVGVYVATPLLVALQPMFATVGAWISSAAMLLSLVPASTAFLVAGLVLVIVLSWSAGRRFEVIADSV